MSLVAGLAAAVLASLLFNLGLVMQALEARREPPELELRLKLVLVLARRWRWVLGFLLGIVGVGPQVLALSLAPFTIVQPALVVGLLLVLAVGVRTLAERVRAIEWVGVAAIIGGVALVAGGAPGHQETHRAGAAVLVVVGALFAASLVPFAVRRRRLDTATVTMVASGVGLAATNIATKLLSDDVGLGHYVNAASWTVVAAAAGVAATVTTMTAFQRTAATVVVPVTTAVQTFLPIALEPLFLRERWSTAPLDGVVLALGLVVVLAGTVVVARARSVSEVVVAATTGAARRVSRATGASTSAARSRPAADRPSARAGRRPAPLRGGARSRRRRR
jgi:drug/metabolite transporter (DMT)-like permease